METNNRLLLETSQTARRVAPVSTAVLYLRQRHLGDNQADSNGSNNNAGLLVAFILIVVLLVGFHLYSSYYNMQPKIHDGNTVNSDDSSTATATPGIMADESNRDFDDTSDGQHATTVKSGPVVVVVVDKMLERDRR